MQEDLAKITLSTLSESGQALGPIALMLIAVFLIFFRDVARSNLLAMTKGVAIAAVGLTIFLLGVRVGLGPYAQEMGVALASGSPAILIVAGFAIGLAVTVAEPAVRILADEIDIFSSGYLKRRIILYTIAIGVAASVALNMVRVRYGIPLLYIVGPGYLLALLLVVFSHSSFTALAFDSGGVATGSMSVSFVMSLAIGVASATPGQHPAESGLGVLALIGMTPILTILLVGLIYKPPRRRGRTN